MKKITGLRNVVGGAWHLAVMASEGEGAVLLRVACWGVESQEGKDDRVVALVVDPETEANSASLHSYDEDDEDVIGLVEPGQEVNGCWNEIALERARGSRAAGDAEERELDGVRLVALLTPAEVELLQGMRACARADNPRLAMEARTAGPDRMLLVSLAERDLVATHRYSSGDLRHVWIITPLGDRVLRLLDKRS